MSKKLATVVALLRRPVVERRTGKKRSAIYQGMAEGTFPKPVPIGARSVAWVESEIEAWIEQRIGERAVRAAARRQPATAGKRAAKVTEIRPGAAR